MIKCIHHWDMGLSHNGIVHSTCRKCLAETDFSNIPVFVHGTFGRKRNVVPLTITAEINKIDKPIIKISL